MYHGLKSVRCSETMLLGCDSRFCGILYELSTLLIWRAQNSKPSIVLRFCLITREDLPTSKVSFHYAILGMILEKF